jgi:hypothetical protein
LLLNIRLEDLSRSLVGHVGAIVTAAATKDGLEKLQNIFANNHSGDSLTSGGKLSGTESIAQMMAADVSSGR